MLLYNLLEKFSENYCLQIIKNYYKLSDGLRKDLNTYER